MRQRLTRRWTLMLIKSVFFATARCAVDSVFDASMGQGRRLQTAFLSTKRISASRNHPRSLAASIAEQPQDLRTLYPPLHPNRNGTLAVDQTHTLFYEEYGRSDGAALTALFLHGGPGAGCFPNHARFFDPSRYRILLLDQRGSGRSKPRGEAFVNNTLWHLVQDCETLRIHLGIRQWDVVLGGSWGSTLAIAYAQEYPSSVRSLVLRGVCLLRPPEVDWLTNRNGGAAAMNPTGWNDFSNAVGIYPSADTGRDALHAYYDRLLGEKQEWRLLAARSWMTWEMMVSAAARKLLEEKQNATGNDASTDVLVWNPRDGWNYQDVNGAPLLSKSQSSAFEDVQTIRRGILSSPSTSLSADAQMKPRPIRPLLVDVPADFNPKRFNMTDADLESYIPAQAMLTCFYSVNSRYALNNVDFLCPQRMGRIRNTRCIAVQGALDAICPPDTALDLHIAWPEMELRIPTLSGHSMYDSGIAHELVQATDRLASSELGRKSAC